VTLERRKLAFMVRGGLHPSGRYEIVPVWLTLLERLAQRHDVHAFVLRHLREPSTYLLRGITVHDLGRPSADVRFGRWAEWRAIRAALARCDQFDVLHGVWVDPGGFLAAVAGRRFSVPTVVTCDSGEFVAIDAVAYGMQRTAGGRALVSAACRLATRVHVTSMYMERLAAMRGYGAVRIPVGIDVARATISPRPDEGPPWKLLQVASLNRVKDQAMLLNAVSIASREIDVRLDLVGEDTLGGALQSHAAVIGIADRVTFHGFRPHDELRPFYGGAHLYVQSSRHEAAGISVLEAAASAVPIVGTHVGYVADWSPTGAIAVEPGNATHLARAIVDTLRDPETRRQIAANAGAFAMAHDVDWTARELEKLYADLQRGTHFRRRGQSL